MSSLPPTILCAGRRMVMLSNGDILLTRSEISEKTAATYPDLLIENNIPEIREAALTSMRALLLITNVMELFSFDDLFSTALEQLANRTKELEDDLLTELPDIHASTQSILSITDGGETLWSDFLGE